MSSPDSSDIPDRTQPEGDMPDPTQQQEYTDIVLVVDDRRLYTCRGLLAMASPVWRRMFAGGFTEKDAKEIPLPGKTFEDMLELLRCITPGILNPVSGRWKGGGATWSVGINSMIRKFEVFAAT